MTKNFRSRGLTFALASAAVVVVFILVTEHWGHVAGYLPYLILLACPLLHMFHHGGHSGHGEHSARGSSAPPQP